MSGVQSAFKIQDNDDPKILECNKKMEEFSLNGPKQEASGIKLQTLRHLTFFPLGHFLFPSPPFCPFLPRRLCTLRAPLLVSEAGRQSGT